jgi:hypothetical protein
MYSTLTKWGTGGSSVENSAKIQINSTDKLAIYSQSLTSRREFESLELGVLTIWKTFRVRSTTQIYYTINVHGLLS